MDNLVDRRVVLGAVGLAGAAAMARMAHAGSLTPPAGAVAPTPGPEPRIPINSTNTPGNASAVFVISQRGSYYLTGNITVADTTHSAILITAADVSIDLMGYTISGVINGVPGILGELAATNLRISDGTVRTCSIGIQAVGTPARIERVTAADNATGILINFGLIVACVATGNTVAGIQANAMAIIDSCVVLGPLGSTGIAVGATGTVTNCAVSGMTTGFFLTGSIAIGCHAQGCADGYFIQQSSTRDCRAHFCFTTGFKVSSVGSQVEGCFGSSCQTGMTMPASGNFIVRNSMCNCTTGYVIAPGTQGGIGVLINATSAVITSDNSYANWIT